MPAQVNGRAAIGVPASTLCSQETLRYLLENWARLDLPAQYPTEEIRTVAWRVLRFFKDNESVHTNDWERGI